MSNRRQLIKDLSGSAFKVFYTLLEITVKEKKRNPNFNGWIQVSYNQLKMMTGVQNITRVLDEFNSFSEDDGVAIIEIDTVSGVSNKYRVAKELVDARIKS